MRIVHGLKRDDPIFRWLRRLQPSENTALLGLAVAVGVGTAFAIWAFDIAIEFFHELFQERLAHEILEPLLGPLAIVIALALAGLIVGWIMHRFIGDERHHGVAGIMESVALAGGRLRYHRVPFKAIAAALSLGAGASVGPEDPSVQIGANMGSFFGQRLRFSEERMRIVVAAGAASAIAAAFRAPIAGVFFALEIILGGRFTSGSISVVVLASVIASVFFQVIGQGAPEFGILDYSFAGPHEMIFFTVLGLLLAPIAVLFIRAVYWQEGLWHRYAARLSRPLKTALAGALVGGCAIFVPQIMGPGREFMAAVLHPSPEAQFTIGLLLIIGLLKLFMTTVSLAGGFVGGIFAPTLFVGTMRGSAFGQEIEQILPAGTVGDHESYAIAGMAALMAGVVRAPITAILMVFELTNDYLLILPIMGTTVVCVFLAERFEPSGIYELGLLRKGIRLQQGRDIDVMQSINVREAMTAPAYTIHESATLQELRDLLRQHRVRSLVVVNEDGDLSGIVTLTDLQRAYEASSDGSATTVADIATREVITAGPDEPLWTAISNMGARDVGRLPVLRPGTRQPIGMLSRHDVMRAYNSAITRKVEEQHTNEQVRLHALTGAHVVELTVKPHALVAGQQLRDVNWPNESVIASIRRSGRLIVPHGSTEIYENDTLTFVAAPEVDYELQVLTGQDDNGQPHQRPPQHSRPSRKDREDREDRKSREDREDRKDREDR
ncbi:MAG: CBS domain-containing protein [Chloroflexi bacterium]|nr:CBS domain-containing protein [Chloroflexota bacterium]